MATFYPQFTSNETISQQWQRYVHTKPLINNIRDIHQANTKEINNVIQNSTKEQIRAINESTDVVCNTLESGFNIIENNLYNLSFNIENLRSEVSEMSSMLDWRMSLLIEQQRISNLLQGNIALLLRIPDIQKERQYYTEQGLKFLKNAYFDEDFYEDSLSNLLKAESIEPTDFFVLHRIGMIYMYSQKHCDLKISEEYFRKAAKYAVVETADGAAITSNLLSTDVNENFFDKKPQIDSIKTQAAESYLLASRCCFIQGKFIESGELAFKSYSVDDNFIEAGFMHAKSLVAIGENSKAAYILNHVINKDRFYSIKIATDVDLCTKIEIKNGLENVRRDALTKAKNMLQECKDIYKYNCQINNIQKEIFQIENLIKIGSYLQCKEAIDLLEKHSERVFTSDFNLKQELFYIGDDYNLFREKLNDLFTIVNNRKKTRRYLEQLFDYLSDNSPWSFPTHVLNNLSDIQNHSFNSKTTSLPLYVFLRKERRYYSNIPNNIISIEKVKQEILNEEKLLNEEEENRKKIKHTYDLETDKKNKTLAIKKSIKGFFAGIFLGFFVGLALDVVYFIYYTFATNLSEQNSHEVMSNCENILLISIIVLGILKAQNDYNSYRKGDKFY